MNTPTVHFQWEDEMASERTVHFQWEDEMASERTGHPTSYAKTEKMKSLMLHAHVCTRISLGDCSSFSKALLESGER